MGQGEAHLATLVALVASGVVTAVAWTFACTTQYECLRTGECTTLGDGMCSFQNLVTPAGFQSFNLTLGDTTALAALTRGVCSPGLRQNLDSHGLLRCMRAPSYPDAYNAEAGDPDGETDHARACGRWIRSRDPSGVQSFGFFDAETVADDVTEQIRLETVTGVDDVSRFRRACERMIVNAAAAPAALEAFDYLKAQLGDGTSSSTQALQQVGVLTSHYCDAPVAIGHGIGTNGFIVAATDGVAPSVDVVSEALYAFGIESSIREQAREFANEMRSAPVSLLAEPTTAQLDALIVGAIGNSWLTDSISIHGTFNVVASESLSTLARVLYAIEETSADHAHAYLTALAARCSFATRGLVTGEFGVNLAIRADADELVGRGAPAVALGRLRPPEGRLFRVGAAEVASASSITWSRLRAAAAIGDASQHEAVVACWDAAAKAFPDQLDEHVYHKLTTPDLIERLPAMATAVKAAVASELSSGRTSVLIADPVERARLSQSAAANDFKIAGAPRGSAFGRAGSFERPATSSSDGALKLMLLQGKMVFLDRLALPLEHQDVCELPTLFASSERNAYQLSASPCSMILPALLVPPVANERYDDASLYGLLGFVFAHEVAHVASVPSIWDATEAVRILANYSTTTYTEAAADLTAADALVATGAVTSEQLCRLQSQLWCGRVEDGYKSTAVHPPPNLRGDALCAWLRN